MPPDETVVGDPFAISGLVTVEVWHETDPSSRAGHYDRPPDERAQYHNLVVTTGRQFLARRIAGDSNQTAPGSIMAWMAVGTGTVAPALTDGTTPGLYGEIKRKALSTNSAGITAVNIYTAVATFGGAAESIQSIAITEAGVFNHVGSGQGTEFQRVTGTFATLADSDLVKLTLETNVGSS